MESNKPFKVMSIKDVMYELGVGKTKATQIRNQIRKEFNVRQITYQHLKDWLFTTF